MSTTVNIHIIQYIAIISSCLFIVIILELIRKKTLKEAYALLWLFFAVLFLILSFWRKGLDSISALMGIAYPPAALFLTLIAAFFLILIQFSIVLSKLSERATKLSQEVGLLKLELEKKGKRRVRRDAPKT